MVALCCLIVRRPNRNSFSALSRMEVCPYSYFRWWGYFRGPWVSFVTTDKFSMRVTKITSRIGVMNLQPTFLFLTYWIMAISSKACKPDNFQPHNSLKLSFTNIRGFRSNFVECESFIESNSPDILALWEANLDDKLQLILTISLWEVIFF